MIQTASNPGAYGVTVLSYKNIRAKFLPLSDTEGNAIVKESILRLCDTGSVYSTADDRYASTA